jgi:membrane fusion protein, hemolysin D
MGLVYAARIRLNKTTIHVEDKNMNLSPGMAVTAEFKLGERRIIEYLLNPLLRYKKESIREQ